MPVTYANIPINIEYSDLKHVIGKSGRHLHCLKAAYGMNKLWYNPRRHIFHIWGDSERLSQCRHALSTHLEQCVKKYNLSVTTWSDISDHHHFIEFDETKIPKNSIPFIIGHNGKKFKKMTEHTGASFVWYDSVRHGVHVWGDNAAATNVLNIFNLYDSSSTNGGSRPSKT